MNLHVTDQGYARIYLDLDNVHPVFDGRWHRVRLDRLPAIGERLKTLCGHERVVAFAHAAERTTCGVPTCCYECDLIYRRQRGIEIRAGHPAIRN